MQIGGFGKMQFVNEFYCKVVYWGGWRQLPALVLLSFVLLFTANAQSDNFDDSAPPPLRLVSKGERFRLESESDAKRRVELALALMDGRIEKAEELRNGEDFDKMFLELGGFHGLMDNTLDYLSRENRRRGKMFIFLKKYEIGLRGFMPRLELIRRDLPARYAFYVKSLLKYVREARSKAIEPFFTDSVVPNRTK